MGDGRKRGKEMGKEHLPRGTKDCLDREKTTVAHRKMVVYKVTRRNPM